MFAESFRTYEAWQLAPEVDARIPFHFALPGNNPKEYVNRTWRHPDHNRD